jgi:hypothetical protein
MSRTTASNQPPTVHEAGNRSSRPLVREHGGAHLYRTTGDASYERWYCVFSDYAERLVIDRVDGNWWHQLDETGRPTATTWDGKPDLYHAFQATLFARAPQHLGLGEAARQRLIAC